MKKKDLINSMIAILHTINDRMSDAECEKITKDCKIKTVTSDGKFLITVERDNDVN